MKFARIAGISVFIAALFWLVYAHYYEAAAGAILVVFLAYFISRVEPGLWSRSPCTVVPNGEPGRSPSREIGKGIVCLASGAAIGLGVGMRVPDVQVGVAFALTFVVSGVVAFVLFLMRALGSF